MRNRMAIALACLIGLNSSVSDSAWSSEVATVHTSSSYEFSRKDADERLLNELYARYVDCLDSIGKEDVCYRRWERECDSVFHERCADLEREMFPDPGPGDESC